MHLTYETQKFSATELMQGDVLRRTPQLDDLLKEVHPHFYNHPKNIFFMVLTQSCDLVQRDGGGGCKAPYISIAPVRTLDLVVERHLAELRVAEVKAELPVMGAKAKTKATEFLRRLLNNNEPGYFYLDSADNELPNDCAAFLNLSIAIKSDLHLAKCIDAKLLQLTETFQAKLGWLVGQQFSRVGTPDWPSDKLTKKVGTVLDDAAIWIDDGKIPALETEYGKIAAAKEDHIMTALEITGVIRKVPTLKQKVMDRAGAVLSDILGEAKQAEAAKIRRRLESDSALTALLK